jgi:hypothetical protein
LEATAILRRVIDGGYRVSGLLRAERGLDAEKIAGRFLEKRIAIDDFRGTGRLDVL